jgi:hypothetical protein
LRAQQLAGPRNADPVAAVRAVFGVQAQDRAAALLAVRARTAPDADDPTRSGAAEITRHLAAGALVRTWAMRGTLHLLAADDLPTAIAIYGPLHLARGRRRLAELGLSPADAERSTEEAAAIVREHGPLDRHELAARLRDRGVPVAEKGQAPIHVVARAAHAGVLIEVGDGLYGPLDLGPLADRDDALRELGRRYAAGHAPATVEDFARWSGLPAADVRTAWGDEPRIEGDPEAGGISLLPAFDEWLLGWASRDFVLAADHAKRVAPGGGIIRPVAIADGRAFATWRLDRRRRRVELDPFGRVTKPMRAGVDAEVAAISDFLGVPLTLTAAG